jgi:phage gpG-like protein
MARLTGDFRSIDRQIRKLEAAKKLLDLVGQQCGQELKELVLDGFRTETNPYGERWDPPLLREGKALSDTGRLRSSWHVAKANRGGVRIATSVDYARYHQTGTGKYGPRGRPIVPVRKSLLSWQTRSGERFFARSVDGSRPRMMVPDSGRGLPPAWRNRILETAREVLETELGPG